MKQILSNRPYPIYQSLLQMRVSTPPADPLLRVNYQQFMYEFTKKLVVTFEHCSVLHTYKKAPLCTKKHLVLSMY